MTEDLEFPDLPDGWRYVVTSGLGWRAWRAVIETERGSMIVTPSRATPGAAAVDAWWLEFEGDA